MLVTFVRSAVTGLALGVAIVFLLSASLVACAFVTETTASVPGMLTAWATTENDLPAVYFEPSVIGLATAISGVAVVFVVVVMRRVREVRCSSAR